MNKPLNTFLSHSFLPWLQTWAVVHIHMLIKYYAMIKVLVKSAIWSVIYARCVSILKQNPVLPFSDAKNNRTTSFLAIFKGAGLMLCMWHE